MLKVLSGSAEKDGTELAVQNAYSFTGIKSKILTWHGCELEIEGQTEEDSVASYASPQENPATSHINLHDWLGEMRAAAAREKCEGPRVLVVGPAATGKTTLVRTLTSYATRQGFQPVVVSADPKEGMLSLPGSLSASVFATIMDPESVDGWGSTPTSGPSVVPVKLPLVYYYGHSSPESDIDFYRELTCIIAGTVSGRFSEDEEVRSSGVIIDSMGVGEDSTVGMDLLAHVVDEMSGMYCAGAMPLNVRSLFETSTRLFSNLIAFLCISALLRKLVNIIVVLGSITMSNEFSKRFAGEQTSLGEPIHVVGLDRSTGAVERSEAFLEHAREQAIKEYFFGDARTTLCPQIQQVEFESLVIYKASECTFVTTPDIPVFLPGFRLLSLLLHFCLSSTQSFFSLRLTKEIAIRSSR